MGFITFSFYADKELGKIINGPLFKKEINEINDDLLNGEATKINNEDDAFINLNYNDFNALTKDENYLNNLDKKCDIATPVENNSENNEVLECYKNKILNLESQIQSLNIKIKTLQVKNQTLEDTNEKLSEKIAILCEK